MGWLRIRTMVAFIRHGTHNVSVGNEMGTSLLHSEHFFAVVRAAVIFTRGSQSITDNSLVLLVAILIPIHQFGYQHSIPLKLVASIVVLTGEKSKWIIGIKKGLPRGLWLSNPSASGP
jgi:hypothetical protein